MKKKETKEDYIYVMKEFPRLGFLKIGWSNQDPHQKVSQMQTYNSREVRIVGGFLNKTVEDEHRLQFKFKDYREKLSFFSYR